MTAVLITTNAQLDGLLEELEGCDRVALDTESNSFFRFHERLCLLQLTLKPKNSDALRDFIVDPIGDLDIKRMTPLVQSKTIKVFHDAGYDLTLIRRDITPMSGPLFDTMLALRMLGEKEFGLASILKKRFGVQADKRFQRADWTKRPMSQGQLDYAAQDTRYLLPLADQLKQELVAKGRWAWFVEDCDRSVARPENKDKTPEDRFWAMKGLKQLSADQLAIAWAVFKLRDERAKALDRAVFRVLHSDAIIDIASRRPKDRRALGDISGVGPSFVQTVGEKVLQAVATPPVQELPKKPVVVAQDKQQKKRFEAWREKRKNVAEQLGVDPEIVLSNATLWTFAADEAPKVAAHPDFAGWRKDLVLKEFER